ncbi:NtaA/DmoA family FMN-dependent monooxygenase [Cellulomonas fimi]|uniref:Nitrilotriacetate monooxygenase component A/pristinamycin IIA synthase subunit A n=1 Tax=Cellulomonas fimi (strain ATCC 484 / DSM 20113 / JCM 1341 / CCUG 24087 / LMG 16345 / NBRC 15513 / NCIMB 8980 / NCTC 7547 / NRS-133) TaxID=590998 RepID=F4H3A4_CELFA|nr:NtaA/DmoA family FMN-dependent monooxygenase [Cellulomonas fimi]AEE45325.1 Nitrilotriacetate monooxygenase component A/pristinamycin IIA synthase subunit A [Cellulomonas fimi ATCC 484]NNH07892.1 NtaA/DmoA family FMN-dependent monooxygenase [Cellulomonas fimi]VEH28970.1 Nitrilotriacetate monooxygenase component A [Cellulomonas fimi]
MTVPRKQVHLGAHFPGVNSTTVWTEPDSGSQIDFASFEHLARSAEDARLDFFFLAEGLRLREHKGEIFDLDVVGRPDTLPVLAALAAVTDRLGLVGTINTTFNEPWEVARQFATLDVLSGGRAAWNLVTSPDAFTGANFRRGGFLPYEQRYERAAELVAVARALWDSWDDDAVLGDREGGAFLRDVEHVGPHFQVRGTFPTPRGPQGHPVLFQAGDSGQGRDFAAATADVVFSMHSTFEDGRAFYRDVKDRLPALGRREDSLKILPATSVVLGDTAEDAAERARVIRRQQVSGPGAIAFLEQVWGVDLTAYDPDGPLPDVEPDVGNADITRGRVRHVKDPRPVVAAWRARAEAERLSIRDLVIAVTSRGGFVGTPTHVADEIDRYVQQDASDGFILVPHLTPHGLDDVLATVVPLLQERGSFRAEYAGPTLRDHLGLDRPAEGRAATAHLDQQPVG